MDNLTQEQRQLNMSRIRCKNTRPELVVRSIVHNLGHRGTFHYAGLPSKPDIIFPRLKKIIFVHGCFWHQHKCRYGSVRPASNSLYWENKILNNVLRDKKNLSLLRRSGWKVLVVWECRIKNKDRLKKRLIKIFQQFRLKYRLISSATNFTLPPMCQQVFRSGSTDDL